MIEKGVELILRGLEQAYEVEVDGEEDFMETPQRVAKFYGEMFGSMHSGCPSYLAETILDKTFPSVSDQMIVQGPIKSFGICPHHLLPVEYKIFVGYLPGKGENSRVLGLSKLARLADVYARRIVKQEEVGPGIVDSLNGLPDCLGAGVVIEGRHMCMVMRGVHQHDAVTETTVLRGKFLEEETVTNEFLKKVEWRMKR